MKKSTDRLPLENSLQCASSIPIPDASIPAPMSGAPLPDAAIPGASIPGNKGLPLVGHTLSFLMDAKRLLETQTAQYGSVHKTRLFGRDYIRLMGPDALQLVLLNRQQIFQAAPGWLQVLASLFEGGLLLMDGDEHKCHRRLLQVAFKREALVGYFQRLQQVIPQQIAALAEAPRVSIYEFVKAATLHMACEVFMGSALNNQAHSQGRSNPTKNNPTKTKPAKTHYAKVNQAFIATVNATIAMVRLPIVGTAFYRGLKGRAFLEKYFRAQIPLRRQLPLADDADLFTRLCHIADETEEATQTLTDQQIVEHMIFLMMAAHDTSASTLTSMLYALTQYPQWQQRLVDEMADYTELSYEQLPELVQLDWFFKETLRLFPPIVSLPRYASKAFEFAGYTIPAGSLIGIAPINCHYDPAYWTQPQQFDPERFSPERREDQRHPFQWAPFGGGVHKCIGMHFAEQEIKLCLFYLLKRYRVEACSTKPVRFRQLPIWRPRQRLWLRFLVVDLNEKMA
jgi:cytochrome P450